MSPEALEPHQVVDVCHGGQDDLLNRNCQATVEVGNSAVDFFSYQPLKIRTVFNFPS